MNIINLTMSSLVQDTLMGSSSVDNDPNAAPVPARMEEDDLLITEIGEVLDFNEVQERISREREGRRETVRKRIADNGFALRNKNAHGRNH
jgi:hypothetical protein